MICILVPVLGREHQIEPLLENIAETTEVDHRVVFICSPTDPAREACLASDAETIVVSWAPDRADFAMKINYAYEQIVEDWYFQAATDLSFRSGWDTKALQCAEVNRVGVVGTNDLGNPLVMRGHHSTHILFSRAYIEQYGGTFDDSGTVFTTAYDHQFIDTEFIQTALARKQFRPARHSIVEHMHPHWKKGEMDATYEKSERAFLDDMKVHNERMRRMRRGLPAGRRRR